jgi:signal transduction histidine kinase
MTEEELAPPEVKPFSSRVDWTLMLARGVLAGGLLLLNRWAELPDRAQQGLREYVLFGYVALALVEALFLWRSWGLRAWPHLTLALDLGLVLAQLFLSGGVNSPLLPLLLFPVVATSLRLGFTAGLGLNLAALAGYAALAASGKISDPLSVGIFGAFILIVGVFGGLIVEQVALPAREVLHRLQDEVARYHSQFVSANKRARVFYEMSHTLSVTMSYQKVLEGVLQDCHRLLDFSAGVVLLSAGEEDLAIAASSGLRAGDAEKGVHLVGGSLSKCLASADPGMLEHLGRDSELSQVLALQRCRSGLIVPLRAGMRNYGAIVLGSINEQNYTRSDLSQLVALAHFATIAIQNAQLYQDLREERDKIIRAEENVRKELSRDLHDGPAQSLAAITMNLEFIKRLLAEDPAQAVVELESLEKLSRKTAWDIRTMLFELRPIILETQGLVPTLEQYVQRFPSTDPMQVHLDTGGFDRRLDPKAETTIFTIMQEAVNNARKHAKGKNIWMRLAQQGSSLVASVQDDGVGFDLEAVQASYEKRGSFGLLNMHERAQLIGSKTEIRSAPGKGTAVIITVPLEQA